MLKNIYELPALADNQQNDQIVKVLQELIEIYKAKTVKQEDYAMPLFLFKKRNLGSLEVVVKYLKENLFLSYSQIGRLLSRDQRSIWTTYKKASLKEKKAFSYSAETYFVPCSIFSNRDLGPLEALVCYLKDDMQFSFKQISIALNRNYSTIWLSYKNGKKNEKKQVQ